MVKNKILTEITEFCKICNSHNNCPVCNSFLIETKIEDYKEIKEKKDIMI